MVNKEYNTKISNGGLLLETNLASHNRKTPLRIDRHNTLHDHIERLIFELAPHFPNETVFVTSMDIPVKNNLEKCCDELGEVAKDL